MSFSRKNWRNNPPSSATPINAAELNRIESGIVEALRTNKGFIDYQINLDQFTTTDHAGLYAVRESNTNNGPDITDYVGGLNVLWMLDVKIVTNHAALQVMTPMRTTRLSGYFYRSSTGAWDFGPWVYISPAGEV